MKNFVYIFLGGGLGSVARYGIARLLHVYSTTFPITTLVANLTACLLLGFFIGLADVKQLLSADARLFWTVGFCGGFSTFSTFSQETLALFSNNQLTSIMYVVLSIFLCLFAVVAGQFLARVL